MRNFPVKNLTEWYKGSARDLPWRQTPDPYRVWVSEIMLQQTRVEAVKGYYARFLKRFPDVRSLAGADEGELLKLWEGLGYYSRARNMKRAAQRIMTDFSGKFPSSYEELLSLPGIGPYTAGAVASIAFGVPVPAVDGNAVRVISRFLADASAGDVLKAGVTGFLESCIPKREPGLFNQALMDLGATVCLPSGAPLCEKCPLAGSCVARSSGTQTDYPVRTVKPVRKVEKKTVFVLLSDGVPYGLKRPDTGLLASLYQLPEAEGFLSGPEAAAFISGHGLIPSGEIRVSHRKHIFTHVEWQMRVYCVAVLTASGSALPKEWILLDREKHSLPTAYRICLPEEPEN